jgi:sterol desaturase/sphingolipid hydroxylase (fatty acid hydroxylase superfamily)
VVFSLIAVISSTLVPGLDLLAAALTGYIASFYGMFQHWNIRAPPWMGYSIQRPESHCVHHQREVHSFNYADLPVGDMFGTFRNPRSWQGQAGSEDAVSRRLGAMLAFVDGNEDTYGAGSLGVKDRELIEQMRISAA